MGSPEFEHAQPFHNPIRTYEYVANESGPGVPPPLVMPGGVPLMPMPVHLAHTQLSCCFDDAYNSQYAGLHPHPPPPMLIPPPYAMPPHPHYPPPVYPYPVAAPPPLWVAGGPMPWASGPKGHHWLGQSRFDVHMSQMHEAANKAASAKEATIKWKPAAKPDDMFWCMSEDGTSKILASFATIETFDGKWHRAYDGIAYFVREKKEEDKS